MEEKERIFRCLIINNTFKKRGFMRNENINQTVSVRLPSPNLGYESNFSIEKEKILSMVLVIMRHETRSTMQLPLLPVELWFIVLEMAGYWYKPVKAEKALSSSLSIGLKEIQITAEQLYLLEFDKRIF